MNGDGRFPDCAHAPPPFPEIADFARPWIEKNRASCTTRLARSRSPMKIHLQYLCLYVTLVTLCTLSAQYISVDQLYKDTGNMQQNECVAASLSTVVLSI